MCSTHTTAGRLIAVPVLTVLAVMIVAVAVWEHVKGCLWSPSKAGEERFDLDRVIKCAVERPVGTHDGRQDMKIGCIRLATETER